MVAKWWTKRRTRNPGPEKRSSISSFIRTIGTSNPNPQKPSQEWERFTFSVQQHCPGNPRKNTLATRAQSSRKAAGPVCSHSQRSELAATHTRRCRPRPATHLSGCPARLGTVLGPEPKSGAPPLPLPRPRNTGTRLGRDKLSWFCFSTPAAPVSRNRPRPVHNPNDRASEPALSTVTRPRRLL